MKIVYLDMDGVLADFDGHIFELGYSISAITKEEVFQRDIVGKEYDKGFFRNLSPLPTLHYVHNFLLENPDNDFEFKILSYVGAHTRIRMVIDDKQHWLNKHGLGGIEFVPVTQSSKYKRLYSRNGTKLLDDNLDLVLLFNADGDGQGYHIDKSLKDVTPEGYQDFKTLITTW